MSNHYIHNGRKGQGSLSCHQEAVDPSNESERVAWSGDRERVAWSGDRILSRIGSERKYSDVLFKIQEKVIPGHMVIIASQSEELSREILSEMNVESGVIEMTGTSVSGLHHFISGFYGSFNFPSFDTALEVVRLADKYRVETIKAAAESSIVSFMKSSQDHIDRSLKIANMTGSEVIKERAAGFFPTILTTDNVISYLLMADESKAIKIKYSCYSFMEKFDVTSLTDHQLLSESQLIDYITFIQSASVPMGVRHNGINGINSINSTRSSPSRQSHHSNPTVIKFADEMAIKDDEDSGQERLTIQTSFPRWSTVSMAKNRGVTKSS